MDLFSLKGREARLSFWIINVAAFMLAMVFFWTLSLVTGGLVAGLSPEARHWVFMGLMLLGLPFWWVWTAAGVRRAHDRGASGRWYLAYQVLALMIGGWSTSTARRVTPPGDTEMLALEFISVIQLAWMLFFIVTLGFLAGQKKPNRYGSPPGGKADNYRAPPV